MKYKSSGTYQPIMSNPVISTLISKRHVIWWVRPILRYSRPLPSDQSTCFLRLYRHFFPPIFFALVSEGLATPGRPCGQASRAEPWQSTRKTLVVATVTYPLGTKSCTRQWAVCHGRVGALIFILSYLRARDPERILPYVDRGTFIF